MNFIRAVILTLYIFTNISSGNDPCENFYDIQIRPFYKIKNCVRSTLTVIARANVPSVAKCFEYAKEKGGLAVNFSPPEESAVKYQEDYYFTNCQVLECPEVVNSTTLVNDTVFDYYSLYGDLDLLDNTTCIRGIGVFRVFYEKQNYTSAISKCQDIGGDLAHILTERRTAGISTLVKNELKAWYKIAFVGLDDIKTRKRFVTPMGDLLNCYKFRSWSPGHPRNKNNKSNCVTIDSDNMWRVVNCAREFPFVCEIYPMSNTTKPVKDEYDCSEFEEKEDRDECEKLNKEAKKKKKNTKNRQVSSSKVNVTEDGNDRCSL